MMSSEQAKVDIINSSCDEKTLIKTLVIIHRDILQNERSVCYTYVEKKLVEALVGKIYFFEKLEIIMKRFRNHSICFEWTDIGFRKIEGCKNQFN